MKQWDKEIILKRETKFETQKEDALDEIRFAHEDGIPDSKTRERLKRFKFDEETIDELFAQIEKEEAVLIM